MDEILDLIDGALSDYELGPDAARWSPDAVAELGEVGVDVWANQVSGFGTVDDVVTYTDMTFDENNPVPDVSGRRVRFLNCSFSFPPGPNTAHRFEPDNLRDLYRCTVCGFEVVSQVMANWRAIQDDDEIAARLISHDTPASLSEVSCPLETLIPIPSRDAYRCYVCEMEWTGQEVNSLRPRVLH